MMSRSAPSNTRTTPASRRAWWPWLGALLVMAVLVTTTGNGGARGLDRSETFVARVPTEMWRRADAGEHDAWLVPYFNGEVRLQKPPMNYWLAMGAHRLLGEPGSDIVREFEARAPSAFAGVLLVFVCVWAGRVAFADRRVALLSGAILCTSVGFMTEAHHARPEMVYALFTGAMGVCFVRSLRADQESKSTLPWTLGGWLCFAGATLTKGPHMPLLVVLGFAIGLLVRSPKRTLLVLRPLSGLALAIAIAGAWFYLVQRAEPDAVRFWISEIFDRTGWVDPEAASEHPAGAWWRNLLSFYYVRGVVQMTAPWCLLLIGASLLPWRRRDDTGNRAMVLWWGALAPLAALSFSSFMRTQYIAPALPLLMPLMAAEAVDVIDRWGRRDPRPGLLRSLHAVHSVAAAALCAAVIVVVAREGARSPAIAHAALGALTLAGLGVVLAATGFAMHRRSPAFAVASVPAAVALAFVAGGLSGAWWSGARDARADFAREVGRVAPAGAPLATLEGEYAVIVYYADRTVLPLASRAELEQALRERPDTLLLTRPGAMERAGATGRVIAEERREGRSSPMILVADVRLEPRPPAP